MQHMTRLSLVSLFAVLVSGCSITAPQYSASIDNVQKIKNAGDFNAKVGKFESSPDKANANPISLRGSSMSSPYDNSYAAYLTEALKQDLSLAGKLKPDSNLEISGTLLTNDIDASGMNTATGDISARFVVKKADAERYNKIKSVHTEWDSSFAAAVALPRAQQQYPTLVQKLIAELFGDSEFLRALQ